MLKREKGYNVTKVADLAIQLPRSDDWHRHTQRNGGHRTEFCGKLFRKGTADHSAVSGGTVTAPRKLSEFSISRLRWQRCARGVALRGMQDLRERMSAAVHLHRQERRQKARLHGQTAVLRESVRHRHFGLHELPDLRRGVSIRSH